MPAPTTATSTRVSFSSLGYSGSFVPVHHTGSFFGLRAAAMLDLVVEPEVLQHHFALLPGVVPKEIRAFETCEDRQPKAGSRKRAPDPFHDAISWSMRLRTSGSDQLTGPCTRKRTLPLLLTM